MREESGVSLADLTTMRVGGPADRLVRAETVDDVVDAVREVDDAGEPLLVVGGGSNLIVHDDGFPGTAVHVVAGGVHVESDGADHVLVSVDAGTTWDDLVVLTVQQGWSGIEALSGIPGSVGATPVQNVGAYGQDVSQTVHRVTAWDRRGARVREMTPQECRFTYRHSVFKADDRYVVLRVVFRLHRSRLSAPIAYAALAAGLGVELGARVPLQAARDAVLAQRRLRGMVLDAADHDTWSCGSFFTNPIVSSDRFARVVQRASAGGLGEPPAFAEPDGSIKTSAAWLIERAGFAKGHGMPGPAALSTKHPLAVTNRGWATAADVVALAGRVRAGVEQCFDVTLVNEPVFVGLSW